MTLFCDPMTCALDFSVQSGHNKKDLEAMQLKETWCLFDSAVLICCSTKQRMTFSHSVVSWRNPPVTRLITDDESGWLRSRSTWCPPKRRDCVTTPDPSRVIIVRRFLQLELSICRLIVRIDREHFIDILFAQSVMSRVVRIDLQCPVTISSLIAY
jgi:hypothetical protein